MNKYLYEEEDTIAAISTPYGKSGVGIIRISGSKVKDISKKFFGKIFEHKKVNYVPCYNFNNTEILDRGLLLFFNKPNSFTGEDVLEFQGHGNPYLLSHILYNILLYPGTRLSNPGEFTKRSYINNKINILEVEALNDLINANSLTVSKLASKSLDGSFSNEINNIIKLFNKTKVFIETYINFSEENIDFNFEKEISITLNKIKNKINILLLNSKQSFIINKGINVVIIGEPNVGKSSFFNAILKKDRSIVTNIPGTTRDSINENLWLDGINIMLTDTAGIHITNDIIENIGINKTKNIIENSDCIILVIDNKINIDIIYNNIDALKGLINSYIFDIVNYYNGNIIIVKNKSDLSKDKICLYKNIFKKNISLITVSAKNYKGINLFKSHLKEIIGINNINSIKFLSRQRHINNLKKSLFYIKDININNIDLSVLSDQISLSKQKLLEIIKLPELDSEEILNEIFSTFCIGK